MRGLRSIRISLTKRTQVYIPTDWEKVVCEARTVRHFNAVPTDSPKLLDFTQLSTKQSTHRKKDTEKKPVLISEQGFFQDFI